VEVVKTRIGIIAAGLVLALVTLTGCTSSNAIPTSWFASTSSGAVYLKWTDTKSGIKGTGQETILPPKINKSPVTTMRYSFVGKISKGKIVLHVVDGKHKETDSGTISTTKLVILNSPSPTFHPGTRQQYTDAVAKLKKAYAARSKG
jgi:hypothetical protein